MGTIFSDILTYRLNLYSFLYCVCISLGLVLLFALWLYHKKRQSHKSINGLSLVWYLWVVLCFTVICRQKGELTQFFPIPFLTGNDPLHVIIQEYFLNILMFVPIGYLLAGFSKSIRWWQVLLIAAAFSCSIEALQWFCKCGSFETNDLINNSIGSLIGYHLYNVYHAKRT